MTPPVDVARLSYLQASLALDLMLKRQEPPPGDAVDGPARKDLPFTIFSSGSASAAVQLLAMHKAEAASDLINAIKSSDPEYFERPRACAIHPNGCPPMVGGRR
jgi:hypothetical protein